MLDSSGSSKERFVDMNDDDDDETTAPLDDDAVA